VIADDERPARSFLAALVNSFEDVDLVGEAPGGAEAIELIEQRRPDLALLDLQMPEIDGLTVVRLLKKNKLPLIAFVTAYDEYAVKAFELNAIDYLLKPVEAARLRETINRAHELLEQRELLEDAKSRLKTTATDYAIGSDNSPYLERIPIRKRDEIVILPVGQIASIVADGELLHITTSRNERHTITYRLKEIESRLDAARFIRLGRGTLANIEMITKVNSMPGGTYVVTLANNQQLSVSRLQSRILRDQFLKL
jgi:two-component system LytT family response regulator